MPIPFFSLRVAACTGLLVLAAACGDSPVQQQPKPTGTASLQIISGDSQVGLAGRELPQAITVRALDSLGNPVAGQIVNFIVTQGGGRPFGGANVTNADGIARERWTLGTNRLVPQTMEARTVDNSTGRGIILGVLHAQVKADSATEVSMGGTAGSVAWAGTSLVAPGVRAHFRDPYGNPAAGVPVTWTVTAGGGYITGGGTTLTTVTDSSGTSYMRWAMGKTLGTNTLTATAGKVTGSVSVQAIAGRPVRATIQPDSLQITGINQTRQITAFAYDALNNRSEDRASWVALNPSIVSVISPSSTSLDSIATVRANGTGTGRVVARIISRGVTVVDTIQIRVQ